MNSMDLGYSTHLRKNGFTLIELLVVVAILAILASLLLAVLVKAREKMRTVICINNQKQWAVAFLSYSCDHEGLIPREGYHDAGEVVRNLWGQVYRPECQDVWYNALPGDPYLPGVKSMKQYWGTRYLRTEFYRDRFIHCPSARFPSHVNRRRIEEIYFSMAMNSQLIPVGKRTIRIGQIENRNPSIVPLFLDNRLPDEGKVHPYQADDHLGQPAAMANRFSARHLRRGNLVFADGHAETMAGSKVVQTDERDPLRGSMIIPSVDIMWDPILVILRKKRMENSEKCATCGQKIPMGSPGGQCPVCLLDLVEHEVFEEANVSSLPKQTIGDHVLECEIGSGGMGVVYEAHHKRLNRKVALKMIRPELATPNLLRRFFTEASAVAKLKHPNITPIFEIVPAGTFSHFTMPLIQGESLKQKIQSGKLTVPRPKTKAPKSEIRTRQREVVKLMVLIAKAVHHAHDQGVYHRDLKPQNILIDEEGVPFLMDFGLAKILEACPLNQENQQTLTGRGEVFGTPEYMSPEQALGRKLINHHDLMASDLYSLGALFHVLLTGKPPFRGTTHKETIDKVIREIPRNPCSRNPNINRDLATICLKCLEKDPMRRYTSAQALAEDLQRWLDGKPILAVPLGPLPRSWRWIKRNRTGSFIMANLFAGLLLALAMLKMALDNYEKQRIHEEDKIYNVMLGKQESLKSDPQTISVNISPSELEILSGQTERTEPIMLGGDYLKVGINLYDEMQPLLMNFSQIFSRITAYFQNQYLENRGPPLSLSLVLYKPVTTNSLHLAQGEVDIIQMNAIDYVLAKNQYAELQLVVAYGTNVVGPDIKHADFPNEAVLFTHSDADTASCAQLVRKTMVMGNDYSESAIRVKAHLAEAGLRRSHFQSITNLPLRSQSEDPHPYKEVVRYVLERRCDVGVAPRNEYEKYRSRLKVLHRFPLEMPVFVARQGLDAATLKTLREAMISLKQDDSFPKEIPPILYDFRKVEDQDFDHLRDLLQAAKEFDEAPENSL